eukprot:10995664-Karenia_brevis.AAC.1
MGAVTQSVLHSWGLTQTLACQMCGEGGTPHHRFWRCSGWRQLRATCRWTYQHMGELASPDD